MGKEQLLALAVDSVKRAGNLSLFWNTISTGWRHNPEMARPSEAKLFIVEHINEVFRLAYGGETKSVKGLDIEHPFRGSIEGDPLDGVRLKSIDMKPLRYEIPEYEELLSSTGIIPRKIYLLEYKYVVHSIAVIQPLFKVVAEYGQRALQLFILGRDRYTYQPFALGIPNGFVNQSLETCLRWTMNLHKGDVVEEI